MELILHKTDNQSVKYIYAALIKYANHLPIQAAQCAQITHNNGKCSIKIGDLDELLDIKQSLESKKLNITLE